MSIVKNIDIHWILSLVLSGTFLFFVQISLSATYRVNSQSFVPSQYSIGERVQLHLEIEFLNASAEKDFLSRLQIVSEADSDDGVEDSAVFLAPDFFFSESAELPRSLDYQIYRVDIFPAQREGCYFITIEYALFSDTLGYLASFLVKRFLINRILIPSFIPSFSPNFIKSSDDEQLSTDLPSLLLKPLSLPWVDLAVAFLIQAVVLLPILAFHFFKKMKKIFISLFAGYGRRRPYRQFVRQLKLVKQIKEQVILEYYQHLSLQIRQYLQSRTGLPCLAFTTEEFWQCNVTLVLHDELEETLWKEMILILERSDDYRFRKQVVDAVLEQKIERESISQLDKERDIQRLLELAKAVEQIVVKRKGKKPTSLKKVLHV